MSALAAARELLILDGPTPDEREFMQHELARAFSERPNLEPAERDAFAVGWLDACALWLLEQRTVTEAEGLLEQERKDEDDGVA